MTDVITPMSEEIIEMREENFFKQLYIKGWWNAYHFAMISIKEILMIINKREDFLDDLQMRWFDESFQNIYDVHIIHTIFK